MTEERFLVCILDRLEEAVDKSLPQKVEVWSGRSSERMYRGLFSSSEGEFDEDSTSWTFFMMLYAEIV